MSMFEYQISSSFLTLVTYLLILLWCIQSLYQVLYIVHVFSWLFESTFPDSNSNSNATIIAESLNSSLMFEAVTMWISNVSKQWVVIWSFVTVRVYQFIFLSMMCSVQGTYILYIYMYILSYYLNHMKWMYSYSDYDYLYSEVLEYKSWNTLTADRTLHFQCQNPRDSILLRLLKKWCKWCSI